MKQSARGIQISLIIHGVLFALLFFLGNSLIPEKRPLVIDFSVEGQRHSGESLSHKVEAGQKKTEMLRGGPKTSPAQETVVKPEQRAVPESPAQASAPQTIAALAAGSHGAIPGSDTGVREAGKSDGSLSGKGLDETPDSRIVFREGHGGEAAKKQYLREHFTYIRELVMKNLNYPLLARKMGWEGKVILSFVVSEDGSVEKISIHESSGRGILDKNAVETIKKVCPLPKPPVKAELVIPIVYSLR